MTTAQPILPIAGVPDVAPTASATEGPPLAPPRGPLSAAVRAVLAAEREVETLAELATPDVAGQVDPYGEDLQLALYLCYELHYRGFAGVDPELEWAPELLALRRAMERPFLAALRADVAGGDDVDAELSPLLVEPVDGWGPSYHLAERGEAGQVAEYVAHRSLYHLKEADPQAWIIPRLEGQAKSSMVTVAHDEYGAGRGERLHARLFADMMVELGLDAGYGAYLHVAPAATLATVNLMSLFGLHRSLRGALIGQFASVEITSSPGSRRVARAMERLDCAAGMAFYLEHVEADAVHEQVVRRGIIADLLDREPSLAPDVVFGLQAATVVEDRLADQLLGAWEAGRSSLLAPLPEAVLPSGVAVPA
ncbi:MAG: iron-containing redox enzyme family protein [Actinomycetota bacterium]|nr:iron-containing redox enzyme family protein [Actinomycetota bacterium]